MGDLAGLREEPIFVLGAMGRHSMFRGGGISCQNCSRSPVAGTGKYVENQTKQNEAPYTRTHRGHASTTTANNRLGVCGVTTSSSAPISSTESNPQWTRGRPFICDYVPRIFMCRRGLLWRSPGPKRHSLAGTICVSRRNLRRPSDPNTM